MNKKQIEKIQKRIMELLPEEKHSKKAELLEDCCSELSRLVSSWIKENSNPGRQIILKGDNVCNSNKSHDILATIYQDGIFLIDPTIWQFFPEADSILVGEYSSLEAAIRAATKKFGGDWHESEELTEISPEDKNELLKLVKENIRGFLAK